MVGQSQARNDPARPMTACSSSELTKGGFIVMSAAIAPVSALPYRLMEPSGVKTPAILPRPCSEARRPVIWAMNKVCPGMFGGKKGAAKMARSWTMSSLPDRVEENRAVWDIDVDGWISPKFRPP